MRYGIFIADIMSALDYLEYRQISFARYWKDVHFEEFAEEPSLKRFKLYGL